MKRFVRLMLILFLGAGLSACSLTWKEEVQLSDGRVIVIERDQINEGGGDEWALNRSGTKPKEYRIRFEYPSSSGKTIEWRSTKKSPSTWPEDPLLFDVIANQPTIYTLVAISTCCEVYSKYIYQNGAWVEERLPEHFEQHATNLFFGNRRDMPSFLNLAEKAKRNSGSEYRQSLKQVGPSLEVTFP